MLEGIIGKTKNIMGSGLAMLLSTRVHGNHTGEMIGFMVYYRICWNTVASVLKLPEQNQLSKNVDLFYRFIILYAVCLAYLMLYNTIVIF